MAQYSNIEWTGKTWNPATGCTKISAGCQNCYAERMARRLKAMNQARYRNGFNVTMHEDLLLEPLKWKRPSIIFVNSMSDLFHEEISFEFIQKVFTTMSLADWHIFQILTKRSKRLENIASKLIWPENVWMGVSVEDHSVIHRIRSLKKTKALVKFISIEPILGPIPYLPISGIDWVIVGGESGPQARKPKEEWIQKIRDRCIRYGIPFFFKQWGGVHKKRNGRLLDGRTWDEFPERARSQIIQDKNGNMKYTA